MRIRLKGVGGNYDFEVCNICKALVRIEDRGGHFDWHLDMDR